LNFVEPRSGFSSEVPPLFGWKVKADQFYQMLIERILQSDDDMFDIFSRICDFHSFIDFHFFSPPTPPPRFPGECRDPLLLWAPAFRR
jgi:hypothetical protein